MDQFSTSFLFKIQILNEIIYHLVFSVYRLIFIVYQMTFQFFVFSKKTKIISTKIETDQFLINRRNRSYRGFFKRQRRSHETFRDEGTPATRVLTHQAGEIRDRCAGRRRAYA
jgi:hypothetical protein